MKIIKNWLRRKLAESDMAETPCSIGQNYSKNSIDSQGVQFTLYKAVGGHVVELGQYDRITDRATHSLHIISNDADFGEALNHIITYEALKR